MSFLIDITNKRFGRLICVRHVQGQWWECLCDCGTVKNIRSGDLRTGKTRSCGCLNSETTTNRNRVNNPSRAVHGLAETPTYCSWAAMIHRCYDPKTVGYSQYGAKGITVCEFLKESPSNLVLKIGKRPEGMSLDRIDGSLGYFCGSCSDCKSKGNKPNIRWATLSQQNRNRKGKREVFWQGKAMHLFDVVESLGLKKFTVITRWNKGLRGDALFAPPRHCVRWHGAKT